MCRILYTLNHGTIASKPVAAKWVEGELNEWSPLVNLALAKGEGFDKLTGTLDFIRFTSEYSNKFNYQK